ncbi:hypothetical protein [Micromonospora viridifaciens]|uniref:hypothetical protein n=1 Tax=Micromonospora viridifaciens TaxID=1881 RepID=UPI0012FD0AA0|nr:hypothetical protein [Micromonospora viridifaciens]
MKAYTMWADPLPPPENEKLFLLGVSHMKCLGKARICLREGRVQLSEEMPELSIKDLGAEDVDLRPDLPATEGTCPFCQAPNTPMTEEDIFPRWLLRELQKRGYKDGRSGGVKPITGPKTPVCADCNNGWMSVVENDAKDLILSLVDHARPITPSEQQTLALWATLKALVIDSATTRLAPRGFGHDLKIKREPHSGTYVWIAAYADHNEPLKVMPWIIYVKESDDVLAICLTFTIVRVALQVLIPYLEGDLSPLEDFMGSVEQIWPARNQNITWPPPYRFDRHSLPALACRVYDNREPVRMEVTLHRTLVAPPSQS